MGAIKRYACFTEAQQAAYERLTDRQRLYVDYRGQGVGKAESYRLAGFEGHMAKQNSHIMESNNKDIVELIRAIARGKSNGGVQREVKLGDKVPLNPEEKERVLAMIENSDRDNAQRIQFYKDVVNGKVRSVKRTVRKDGKGNIIETKIEESTDVDLKMKARKELDRLLGLNDLPDFSCLQMGDITINIVDASKKDEKLDAKDEVVIDADAIFEQVGDNDLEGAAKDLEENEQQLKGEQVGGGTTSD